MTAQQQTVVATSSNPAATDPGRTKPEPPARTARSEDQIRQLCARVASRVSRWGPGGEGRLDARQVQARIVQAILECDLDAEQDAAVRDKHPIAVF